LEAEQGSALVERRRHFDSVTRGRSIGISFWLGSQLFERPLCRFLRCGCDDELRLLHLDPGHSGLEFFCG
jgi:hypothetical protein